jgi:uncharacterized membrane protein
MRVAKVFIPTNILRYTVINLTAKSGATAGLGLIFAQLTYVSNYTDDMHLWIAFVISVWGWLVFFTSAVKYNQARNIAALQATELDA